MLEQKNKYNQLVRMNLQHFADPEPDPKEPFDPKEPDPEPDPEDLKDPKEEMIPKSEMEKIIKDRLAREKKATEKAIAEAEKLAKMNAEQKKEYEYEKALEELEEYKKRDAFHELSKEAQKMLSEHGIQADDEVFNFVVKETAEDTQKAVQSFVSLFNSKVEEGVKAALAGKSPKINSNKEQAKNPFAKETFNLTEQGKLLKDNPELYKQLKAQANK